MARTLRRGFRFRPGSFFATGSQFTLALDDDQERARTASVSAECLRLLSWTRGERYRRRHGAIC